MILSQVYTLIRFVRTFASCILQQWETIYEDDFSAPEPEPEPESDDSDFEFDGVRTKKISKRKKDKEKKEKEKEKEKVDYRLLVN